MQKLASTQLPDHLSGFVVNWRITAPWKENSLEYVLSKIFMKWISSFKLNINYRTQAEEIPYLSQKLIAPQTVAGITRFKGHQHYICSDKLFIQIFVRFLCVISEEISFMKTY